VEVHWPRTGNVVKKIVSVPKRGRRGDRSPISDVRAICVLKPISRRLTQSSQRAREIRREARRVSLLVQANQTLYNIRVDSWLNLWLHRFAPSIETCAERFHFSI
jgi:hypothetical protein